MNRDKGTLKKYYDLKLLSSNSNNSGDSGVGDFICMSASSSSNSSMSVSQNNAYGTLSGITSSMANTGYNLIASLSLTSLANVSIFENEEYFCYFHKLIQQFNFIEFNLKISKEKQEVKQHSQPKINQTPSTSQKTPSSKRRNSNTQPPVQQLQQQQLPLPQQYNTTKQPSMTTSPSAPNPNISFNNNNNNSTNSSHSVFNLKNISKRLNIKSWFSSSQQPQPASTDGHQNSTLPSISSHNLKHGTGSQTLKQKSSSQAQASSSSSKMTVKTSKNKGPINKLLNSSNLMKHSLSEPSLNELME